MGLLLASGERLLRVLEGLMRVSPVPTKRERIALDDVMDDMEEVGHAEALQPLFGKLVQGLGSITDQVQYPSAEPLEPLLQQYFPGGIGTIFCHLFQQQIPRGEVHRRPRSYVAETFHRRHQ